MPSRKCKEGDLIAIPLPGGGFGAVIIARRQVGRRGVGVGILVYGFCRRFLNPESVGRLIPRRSNAPYVALTSDAFVGTGAWIIAGSASSFSRDQWPLPPFRQAFGFSKHYDRVFRDEDTLIPDYANVTPIGDEEAANYLDHVCYGCPSVENQLEQLICKCEENVPSPLIHVRPRSAALEASETDNSNPPQAPLNLDQFWKLIDAARKAARGDQDELVENLRTRLARLSAAKIASFHGRMQVLLASAYRWDLWAAAFIMNGGCSDDGFAYFRAWLVAQGRETFEKALENPESLAAAKLVFADAGEYELESLLYAASEAYEEKTGDALPQPTDSAPPEPAGVQWTEDDLPSRYPVLWEKFAKP